MLTFITKLCDNLHNLHKTNRKTQRSIKSLRTTYVLEWTVTFDMMEMLFDVDNRKYEWPYLMLFSAAISQISVICVQA